MTMPPTEEALSQFANDMADALLELDEAIAAEQAEDDDAAGVPDEDRGELVGAIVGGDADLDEWLLPAVRQIVVATGTSVEVRTSFDESMSLFRDVQFGNIAAADML